MNIIKKVGRNEAVIKDDKGNVIRMIFSEEDNNETENAITECLLTSYEQRMKETCKIDIY